MESEKTIYVYENWSGNIPKLIGRLYADIARGKENYSFEFDDKWLAECRFAFPVDSDINLYRGRQYTPAGKVMFGIFSDSCPDRWGRRLMQRRENIIARRESRKPRTLQECDFLLGVYDESRMGALRFALEEGGDFLSHDKEFATPSWVSLRKLEAASMAYEKDETGLDDRWVTQLIAPGSSLGGARPKASVEAPDGSLWIAKFPSRNDEYDVAAWEMVVHELAFRCGLDVPEAKLEKFSKNGSTFLVKRFDRLKNRRIHFSSAMTMLGKTDGDHDGSYLEIAAFIKGHGARPADDLRELWRRIVFNMAVSNTDDHFRNHGFLLTSKGWVLSPVYDVNPVPYGDMLSLNVDETDSMIDIDLALSVSEQFGIKLSEAKKMADEILEVVSVYPDVAKEAGISRNGIMYMEAAFMKK